jgi:hypothetical protein
MPKTFKCTRCDRSFAMPAHLGRHMSTMHGVRRAKATPKSAAKARAGRPVGFASAVAGSEAARVLATVRDYRDSLAGQRAQLDEQIEAIDRALTAAGAAPAKAARPALRTPRVKPAGRQRRRRYDVSGGEYILGLVRRAGERGVTTADVVAHWAAGNRRGSAYNEVGKLVQARKLKKTPLGGGKKGSRYTVA